MSGLSLLLGVSGRGRRSATAAGHAGGATGRFKSIGAGQNRTRLARRTYWSGWLGRGSNGNWPAMRGGGGTRRSSSRWRLQWTGRRDTSLGAQGRYGECFPSVKMTGRRLPRSVDGGPRDGGYGARWPGYLGPNRLIERAWEQQREVRRLTEWWLVDVDVRKGSSAVGSSA